MKRILYRKTDGSGGYHVKQNKSDPERKYIICGLFVCGGGVETEWGITKGQGGASRNGEQENINRVNMTEGYTWYACMKMS